MSRNQVRAILCTLALCALGNTDCEQSRRCRTGSVEECTAPDPRWTDLGWELAPLCEFIEGEDWDPRACALEVLDPFVNGLETGDETGNGREGVSME